MVKRILLIGSLLLLLVLGYFLERRPFPPPPDARPRRPSPDAGPQRPPPPADQQKVLTGIVTGYRYNAHLDVNSIQLKTAREGAITIDFRPHTARTVMDCATPGDSVEVSIGTNPNDEDIVYQLHRVENLRTHRQADLDGLPPPPDVPPGYTAENFTIVNPQLLTDPYGGIDGIREGNLLFHFKPGLVDAISGLLKSAKTITLSAVRRSEDFGFVNINHDKVYIALTVTIDNKTFLVR